MSAPFGWKLDGARGLSLWTPLSTRAKYKRHLSANKYHSSVNPSKTVYAIRMPAIANIRRCSHFWWVGFSSVTHVHPVLWRLSYLVKDSLKFHIPRCCVCGPAAFLTVMKLKWHVTELAMSHNIIDRTMPQSSLHGRKENNSPMDEGTTGAWPQLRLDGAGLYPMAYRNARHYAGLLIVISFLPF